MKHEQQAAPEPAIEQAMPAIEATPVSTQQRLLSLQRSVGNQAFGRMIDRWKAGKAVLAREDIPTEEEIKEAEAWAAEGVREGKDLTPGAGGAGFNNAPGGFDASYDPKAGELTIIMRCGVEFVDGITKDGVAAKGLEEELEKANKLPALEREARLATFRWPEPDDDVQKVTFNKDVEAMVEPFWSGQHEFFLRKKGWSWLGAKVKVDLKVDNKSRVPDAHLTIRPVKVPDDVTLGAAVAGGDPLNARDQVMNVTSNVNASGSFLTHFVTFGVNRHDVVGDQATKLQAVIDTFKGAETAPGSGVADVRSIQTPVVLTGHASATGSAEYNLALSQKRVDSVAKFMRDHGFLNVTTRVSGEGVGEAEASGGENENDRRVDIVIGSGNSQNTLRHEFGHAFGLGDEYAGTPLVSSGPGVPTVGQDATHDNLVKKMVDAGGTPLKGAVCEPTDSIMSVGDVVRPQHYATFHAALTKITAPQEPWALGPPTGRNDPLPGAAAPGTSAPAPGAAPEPVPA
ncbi:MAG TPA: OmpA family protein [Solirubrobacter sp.]|nr:OmpA family protein [Solirubrobacter sp.]